MTVEQKLKDMILKEYGSVREFTIRIDIPYSTLDTIFRRGVQNSTVSNVIKICNALHISADALADGKIEYTTTQINKETHDIAEILANTKRQLLSDNALMFNGKPADEESIQSILDAMEVGIEIAKRKVNKR